MAYIIWILTLFFILSGPLMAKDYPNLLKFSAYDKFGFVYYLDYSVEKKIADKSSLIQITTTRYAPGIREKNITTLSKSNAFLSLSQSTQDIPQSQFFQWKITMANNAMVTYRNIGSRRLIHQLTPLPPNAYPSQALPYLLNDILETLTPEKLIYLIMPPSQIVELTPRAIGMETILFNGKAVPCYKVELALKSHLGYVGSVINYWLTMDKPHILVKSKSPDITLILDSIR